MKKIQVVTNGFYASLRIPIEGGWYVFESNCDSAELIEGVRKALHALMPGCVEMPGEVPSPPAPAPHKCTCGCADGKTAHRSNQQRLASLEGANEGQRACESKILRTIDSVHARLAALENTIPAPTCIHDGAINLYASSPPTCAKCGKMLAEDDIRRHLFGPRNTNPLKTAAELAVAIAEMDRLHPPMSAAHQSLLIDYGSAKARESAAKGGA